MFELIRVLLERVFAAKDWAVERPFVRMGSHVIKQVMPLSEELVASLLFIEARQLLLAHKNAENPVGLLVAEFDSNEAP